MHYAVRPMTPTAAHDSTRHQPFAPIGALLVNAFVWGVSWIPFRHLDGLGLHSLWTTAWIYALCATLVIARYPDSAARVLRSPWLWMLALGSGLTNACFNWGVTIGEVVRVVLLFYLMPVWAVLFARLLLGEPIRPSAIARIALAIVGAAIVLWQPGGPLPLPASFADWLGLAGGAAFAMTNVLLRKLAADPPQARALAMFSGGLIVPGTLALALSAAPAAGASIGWPPVDAGVAAIATATALLFLIANLSLQYGAARLPAGVTAVVMLSEVPFAAISAAMIGGETLGTRTLFGGALIVAASAFAAFSRPKPDPRG